jgi:hypothetical protein
MSVRKEVERLLNSRGRIEEGVSEKPDADIANLRAAVQELQATVLYLADELDRRATATT